MKKHRRFLIIGALVALVIALMHFIPFDSRQGYLDYGSRNTCVGYLVPVDYTYRWITGGVNTWDDQLSHLKETKLVAPYSNRTCEQPAHVKLYLL